MKNHDRSAGFQLLETGTLVDFSILKTHIERTPGGGHLYVRAEMQFEADDQEEAADSAEWGSFGFIFALAVLSFADARPRGFSSIEYRVDDEFGVDDFFKCLSFQRGELHFLADYIRGRSMKTEITVTSEESVTLTTWGRGKAALRWLDRLQGKKIIRAV